MKTQLVLSLLLSAVLVQASESVKSTSFSTQKQVEEEPGAEKVIMNAQADLVQFLETGVISAQAQAALVLLSQDKANEGKSLERMTLDALKELNKK